MNRIRARPVRQGPPATMVPTESREPMVKEALRVLLVQVRAIRAHRPVRDATSARPDPKAIPDLLDQLVSPVPKVNQATRDPMDNQVRPTLVLPAIPDLLAPTEPPAPRATTEPTSKPDRRALQDLKGPKETTATLVKTAIRAIRATLGPKDRPAHKALLVRTRTEETAKAPLDLPDHLDHPVPTADTARARVVWPGRKGSNEHADIEYQQDLFPRWLDTPCDSFLLPRLANYFIFSS